MSREILFRGKSIETGEWIEGSLVKFQDIYTIIYEDYEGFYCECKVEPETVCQFTGLYDLKKKAIFEGDIVRVCSDCDGYYIRITEVLGVVKFDDECGFDYQINFEHIHNSCEDYLCNYRNDIEVVGNIYDNPELLEVDDDQ